ncbi:hypothetical protein IMX26_14550 [Clostridium sp. 'deep sea']|uniref:hypothetical protein n=1 Tax=Clostridium sp. 'deep sea' TaxID=2779445 RepID=UPI0018965D38|nr:hypothetical protein [Clostridium sp. 'deep sea']QOR34675.1 hypothetical protein IMX26_14550 [Clostridium sp. 'deep sea']
MKYKKLISFILTVTFILLLMCYENQFQNVHNALILESNDLFSPHHLLADNSVALEWNNLQNKQDNFRVFGLIEKSVRYTVMSIYSTDYTEFKPPLHSGISFSRPNSQEAVVGRDVQTITIDNKEYFYYHDKKYRVIGKIGISEDSPLKKHVLINDTALLNKPSIPLVFDGNNIKNITWLKGQSFETKGVERWFNLTFISKLINWTVLIVIIGASALAAYFFEIATCEANLLRYQTGVNLKNILLRGLIMLTTTTLISIIILFLLAYYSIFSLTILKVICNCLLSYCTMVVTYFKLSTKRVTKETAYD